MTIDVGYAAGTFPNAQLNVEYADPGRAAFDPSWLNIALGVVMLMQPFSLWAYGWSFLVTLVGTVMFIVVSHFPD